MRSGRGELKGSWSDGSPLRTPTEIDLSPTALNSTCPLYGLSPLRPSPPLPPADARENRPVPYGFVAPSLRQRPRLETLLGGYVERMARVPVLGGAQAGELVAGEQPHHGVGTRLVNA